jgi:peptidoglycan/LPS O-acetylase OafA/YrhL
MEEAHIKYWLHFSKLEVLWPTFVGSLLFAVPCALISYWIVERSLEKYARLRHGRGTLAA